MSRFFNARFEILIRFFAEAVHLHNRIPVSVQMEQICIGMQKAFRQKFFQRRFGKSVDIHRVPAAEMGDGFNNPGRTVVIDTEVMCFIRITD